MDQIACIAFDPGVKVAYAVGLYTTITRTWDLVECGLVRELRFQQTSHRKKSVINTNEVVSLLSRLREKYPKLMCVIEDVHPMPKQGVVSTGTFMRAVGVIEGICAALNIPRHYVHATVWKKRLGVTSDKNSSLYRAQLLFPGIDFQEHNRAEAALLLYYFLQHRYSGNG